jgi:hypothetical protein
MLEHIRSTGELPETAGFEAAIGDVAAGFAKDPDAVVAPEDAAPAAAAELAPEEPATTDLRD